MGMANFPDVIKHGYWPIFITLSISYLGCLVIFFFPAMSYIKRATATCFLVFAVGISIIYTVGPFLASREWLFSFSIIASVLLGWPGAVVSITMNTITFAGIGILIKIGFWEGLFTPNNPLFMWFQISTDLFYINVCTTLFITFLFQKIEKSDRNNRANSKLLLKEQVKLIKAKNKLEEESRERKKITIALAESEKKYKHLFNHAPAGMYEVDFSKNQFINVNKIMCRYSGYSKEEFLSMAPQDLFTENYKNLYIERLKKLSAGETFSGNAEYNLLKKDGEKGCVILNNDFIYKNKKLKGASVVIHDISKLKQAEKEKIIAQQIASEQKKLALVGQIAGKMAHDFNNILGIIMGNAELSLMGCKEVETKKTLKLIFEQTIRGKNLTKNLIAFAKSQEPKQEFFSINKKIDLVLSLLKKDLEGIELIKKDTPNLPHLLADPGMIEHALVNLLQNSIHATSTTENPKIVIRTYSQNDTICFEIEDNGCGIPKNNFENIFEPSFTLKGTKDVTGSYESTIKGTGYGMANVKKYIELHKGWISFESTFGSGTNFTISLPVIKKQLTIQEKTEITEEAKHFGKFILLVEDETAISDVQYRVLTQAPCNHKVDIAKTGQVALDLFDKNRYDFISLDYVLPGKINGMNIYNHIRKKDKTIPILFISGNINFLESIKELKQKDTNLDHLSKPCQNLNYLKSIDKLLERALKS